MTVYDYVKVLADERKLTIKDLGDSCGISQGTIGKWKEGSPKLDMINKIAEYFDVPIEYFLTGIRPDRNEHKLIQNYRNCDADGKTLIMAKSIEESRRCSEERKNQDTESA